MKNIYTFFIVSMFFSSFFPHDQHLFFSFQNVEYVQFLENFFALEFLAEGKKDMTSEIFVPKNTQKKAEIVAKSSGILAGKAEICFLVEKFFPHIEWNWEKNDGDVLKKNEILLYLKGNAHEILHLERIVLNVLSRLSGIATTTKKFSDLVFPARIAATRKTHWGFLDKKAVFVGGGLTHRLGLFDAILIKENHLLSAEKNLEGIVEILANMNIADFQNAKFLEIEVETEEEFFRVFSAFLGENIKKIPKIIMFDDFLPEKISEILQKIDRAKAQEHFIVFEASGGISEKNAVKFAQTGVDVLSSGNLTNAVFPVDFSLRMHKD